MTELLRLIKAVQLPQNKAIYLKEHHLLAAFQELGRVYEYGLKSPHAVADSIFNYTAHSETSIGDLIMSSLASELLARNYRGLLLMDVMNVANSLQQKLKSLLTFKETRECLCKHFEMVGYEVRAGANRPLFQGKKAPALMLGGALPRHIVPLRDTADLPAIINKIYGELK